MQVYFIKASLWVVNIKVLLIRDPVRGTCLDNWFLGLSRSWQTNHNDPDPRNNARFEVNLSSNCRINCECCLVKQWFAVCVDSWDHSCRWMTLWKQSADPQTGEQLTSWLSRAQQHNLKLLLFLSTSLLSLPNSLNQQSIVFFINCTKIELVVSNLV